MSNKLKKEQVVVKATIIFDKKIDNYTGAYGIKAEFDGTTRECMIAIATLMVDLENHQPEEDRAAFRSDMMETINKIRCRQVV